MFRLWLHNNIPLTFGLGRWSQVRCISLRKHPEFGVKNTFDGFEPLIYHVFEAFWGPEKRKPLPECGLSIMVI